MSVPMERYGAHGSVSASISSGLRYAPFLKETATERQLRDREKVNLDDILGLLSSEP